MHGTYDFHIISIIILCTDFARYIYGRNINLDDKIAALIGFNLGVRKDRIRKDLPNNAPGDIFNDYIPAGLEIITDSF